MFSARNTAAPVLKSIKEDIQEIGTALRTLGATTVKPEIDLRGDKEATASAAATKGALEGVEGKYEAELELKKDKEFKTLAKDFAILERFDGKWKSEVEFAGLEQGKEDLKEWERQWKRMKSTAHKLKVESEFPEVRERAREVLREIDNNLKETRHLKADFKGADRIAAAARKAASEVDEATQAASRLDRELERVEERRQIRIEVDKRKAEHATEDLERDLSQLTRSDWEVKIGTRDITKARTEYNNFKRDIDRFSGQIHKLELQDNTPEVAQRLKALRTNYLEPLYRRRESIKLDLDDRAAKAKAVGMAGLMQKIAKTYHIDLEVRGAAGVVATMAALSLASRGIQKSLGAIPPIAQAFAQKMYFAQQASYAFMKVATAIGIAALPSLVSGLTIAVASLGAFAGGLGLIAMAGAPIISFFANMRQRTQDLANAQSELDSAQDQARQSAEGVKTAEQGVADAYRQGQEQIRSAIQAHNDANAAVQESYRARKEAVQGVREAEMSAEQGVTDAIQAHRDALQGVEDAQYQYKQTQQDSRMATQELKNANQDLSYALQTEEYRLQDLRYELQGMGIDQKELALDIRQARRDIANAENPMERKRAQLNLERLLLREKQLTDDIKESRLDLNRAEKNGTDELISAEEARRSAQQGVTDAMRQQKEARRAITEAERAAGQAAKEIDAARLQGAQEVKDAQRGVAEAQRGIVEALKNEKRTQREIGAARRDASRAMADANKALRAAQKELMDAQDEVSAKQKAVNALLGKMPRHLQKIQGAIQRFKDTYKVAFKDAQIVTAHLATRLINLGTRALPRMGRTATRTGLQLNQAFNDIGREWRVHGALESIRKILRNMPHITGQWTRAFGRFGAAFINVMGQAMPFARRMADSVARTALAFLRWTDSEKGRRQIRQFFKAAGPVAKALWDVIKGIAGGLLSWSISHPKQVGHAIRIVGGIVIRVAQALMWAIRATVAWARQHPHLARLAIAIGAVVVAAWLFKGPILLAIKLTTIFGRVGIWAAFAIGGALGFTGLAAGAMGAAVIAAAAMVIAAFARLYKEWVNFASPTFRGLEMMVEQGRISMVRAAWAGMRAWIASMAAFILKGITTPVRAVWGLLEKIPGRFGDAASQNLKRLDGMIKGVRNSIAGNLNQTARDMGRAGHEGAGNFTDALEKMAPNIGPSMKDLDRSITGPVRHATTEGSQDLKGLNNSGLRNMKDLKEGSGNYMNQMKLHTRAALDDTKKGGSKSMEGLKDLGLKDLKDFKGGGLNNIEDLKGGGLGKLDDLKGGGLGKIDDLKVGSLKDLGGFNKGGNEYLESLRKGGTEKMWDMEGSVTKATYETQKKGVSNVNKLYSDGRDKFADIQANWVNIMRAASYSIQQALNDIIVGLQRFIDHADIDMKKPEKFSIMGPYGGSKATNPDSGPKGSGGTSTGRRARGGIDKFASGGIAPVGGVANGTTRVFGEVPGTTEFYVTDNPRYRDRNLEILRQANQHMMASGGTLQIDDNRKVIHDEKTGEYRIGGEDVAAARIKKGKFSLMGGDHQLGMRGPLSGRALRAGKQGWKAPSTFERGRDARVFFQPGVGAGRTTSGGTISVDPNFRGTALLRPILQHEIGHAGGLGHSSSGIMTAAVGPRSRVSSAERKWWHRTHEARARGGGGGGGHGGSGGHGGNSGSGGDNGRGDRQNRQDRRDDKKADRKAKREKQRKAQRKWNKSLHKRSHPMSAKYWLAKGDVLAHGPNPGYRPMGKREERFAPGGTFYPKTAQVVDEIKKKHGPWAHGTRASTYPGHGADKDPKNSVDFFVGPFNNHLKEGSAGKKKGDAITQTLLSEYGNFTDYIIWWHDIYDSGGKSRYTGGGGYGVANHSDPDQAHTNHVHWESLENNPGPSVKGGAGSVGPSIDYDKMFDKYVPQIAMRTGSDFYEAMSLAGQKMRSAAKDYYISKAPSSSGGMGGTAGPGLTMMEAITQGGFPESKRDTAVGVAWEESGGDAGAKNPSSTAYGLFQFLKSTAQGMGLSYSKMGDPVYASKAANKLSKQGKDWGPWAAYPPSASSMRMGDKKITGYSNGGLARVPHLGVMGERGKKGEVMWPLDDPRTTRAITNAFDQSRASSSHKIERNYRRNTGGGGNLSEDAMRDIMREVRAEIRESFKETELGGQTVEKLVEFGVKTALAAMKSDAGGHEVNKHVGKNLGFHADMNGWVD